LLSEDWGDENGMTIETEIISTSVDGPINDPSDSRPSPPFNGDEVEDLNKRFQCMDCFDRGVDIPFTILFECSVEAEIIHSVDPCEDQASPVERYLPSIGDSHCETPTDMNAIIDEVETISDSGSEL
jgi:hypothetical protein